MKIVYYHLPESEDEAVLVSDTILHRDVDLAILVEANDFSGGWEMFSLFHDGESLNIEPSPDSEKGQTFFMNLGDGAFEALLPFRSTTEAQRMSDTIRGQITFLERMWDEEGDDE